MRIKQLGIEGFRSLRKVTWCPGSLNLVIGPNGSGKSNLLRFLELISISAQGKLGKYIQSLGGMDPIVWDDKADSIKCLLKTTPVPVGEEHGPEQYELEIARLGAGSSYKIASERLTNFHEVRSGPFTHNPSIPPFQKALASIAVYHDIHTDKNAPVRRP